MMAIDVFSSRTSASPLFGLVCGALLAASVSLASTAAFAEASKGSAPDAVTADTEQKKVRVIGEDGKEILPAVPTSDVERYCTAIADPARDARAAIQQKRLQDIEAEVAAKIDALEAKRREYQDWLEQRRAFIDSTSSIMLDIYATMKPDAAAAQLAGIERVTAASVIAKLKPRAASAILSEMPPKVAAEVANLIAQKTNKSLESVAAATPPRQG